MAGSGRAVDVNHLHQGHQKIKEGLHRVEKMTSQENKGVKRSPVLEALTAVMKELNGSRSSDLVKVRKEMDDATKKRLGAEFNFAKTQVPTRPHPTAPDAGGIREIFAGLPAAMDRLKDMGRDFARGKLSEGVES
ncbi:hypothetical protein HDU93_004709 [Gonapodya sp. JEL0774]|nr:hypothetical protein HDU93_004709 [Gonapodya sp. JEL0774]